MSKEKVQQRPGVGARVPCLGILLVLLGVTVFQCGSVLAKKMTLHPVTMLLFRELVLQKVPSEANPKVRNHGEGPY